MLFAVFLTLQVSNAETRPSPPARERQERSLPLSAAPVELRVGEGIVTTVVFDTPLEKESVELEGPRERFRLVDVGERTLVLEPLADLEPGERLRLGVRYREGSTGVPVTFLLVSHPSEVDSQVEVLRPQRVEALLARLAELEAELATRSLAGEPADFILAGRAGDQGVGVFTVRTPPAKGDGHGLKFIKATRYQSSDWMVLTVRVRNPREQEPWSLSVARLLRADGTRVEVRRARMDVTRLPAGEEGVVALETAPVSPDEGPFLLELEGAPGGRRLLRTLDLRETP